MTITNLLCDTSLQTLEQLAVFFRAFLNNPRKWLSIQNNTHDKNNNKNISDLKNANLKKDAVSSIYPCFLTYRIYLSVTEKSNTYGVSFPQAFISKNNSVSLNQLKGLLPWDQANNARMKELKLMFTANERIKRNAFTHRFQLKSLHTIMSHLIQLTNKSYTLSHFKNAPLINSRFLREK